MNKNKIEIVPIIIENQQKHNEIGRVLYIYIQNEIKKLKGEIKDGNE